MIIKLKMQQIIVRNMQKKNLKIKIRMRYILKEHESLLICFQTCTLSSVIK